MRNLATVSVRHDAARAIAEIRNLRAGVSEKATARALNKALDKVATETSDEIRKVYNVKKRAITAALRKRRAHSRSLYARLLVEGVRLNLIEFSARAVNPWNVAGRRHRRRGGGVSVQIKVAGGRKLVQGAFITASTANNARGGGSEGMRQVWRRGGAERTPILNLTSISVPQAFANKAVLAAAEKWATLTFNKELAGQLNLLTKGRRS